MIGINKFSVLACICSLPFMYFLLYSLGGFTSGRFWIAFGLWFLSTVALMGWERYSVLREKGLL